MTARAILPAWAMAVLGLAWAEAAPAGDRASFDSRARLAALTVEGESVEITSEVRLACPEGKGGTGQHALEGITFAREAQGRRWRGTLSGPGGAKCLVEQTAAEEGGALVLSVKLTAQDDWDLQEATLRVNLPIEPFAGSRVRLAPLPRDGAPQVPIRIVLPARLPLPQPGGKPDPHRLAGTEAGSDIVVESADGQRQLTAAFGKPVKLLVQDERKWKIDRYNLCATIVGPGKLAKGHSAELTVRLTLAGKPDRRAALLELEASRPLFPFDGFGGNYCFALDSPTADYTLADVRSRWARIEMKCLDWDARRDAGPEVRRSLEIARELARRNVPMVISIWKLPPRFYADPKAPPDEAHALDPARWPELLNLLGAYLKHAKAHYGVEPDLFSFNEPDYGVRVKFSPQDHAEAIKKIGAHFANLGLRTKMLLGDVADAKHIDLVQPALRDSLAMLYVGAIAFHSWGGVDPDLLARWAQAARKAKRPLLCSEMGFDPRFWAGSAWQDDHYYAMRELKIWQELLLHGQVAGGMYWEFSADYQPVRLQPGRTPPALASPRYSILKQFCNLTPPKAQALATRSDRSNVLFTAFASSGSPKQYALHIANLGGAREATLRGVPADIQQLYPTCSSEGRLLQEFPALPLNGQPIQFSLPAQSLLTLTTAPPELACPK